MTIADDLGEQGRLTEVYGRLRLKLLDLSKKNRMLNYNLGNRSKRHLTTSSYPQRANSPARFAA